MPPRSTPTASSPWPRKRPSSSTTACPNSRAPPASGGWADAKRSNCAEDRMIAFFLFLVIVAIALGIVGVVVKGLLYLLIIGIVVFLVALLLGALRLRRARGGPAPASFCRGFCTPPGVFQAGLG